MPEEHAETPVALVVGATGIAGSALIERATDLGWDVYGLARRIPSQVSYRPVEADLGEPAGLAESLSNIRPTHVFYTSWAKMPTEAQNCLVNGAMIRNLFTALRPQGSVRHAALMTGLKHYLGPFEAYGQGPVPDTPFHEDEPRLPVQNFYYDQEDELFSAAKQGGFTWSVHRSHTVIGYALGNAMNMGLTLAAAASICQASGRPFVFPGSEMQWNGLTDMTDSRLLAKQMIWAARDAGAADTAFNIVNGDVFRWRWLWPRLAEYFNVKWEGFQDRPRPLEQQMADAEPIWRQIAADKGLIEPDIGRVASWWHTDGDLGRAMECITDMARSRRLGFTDQIPTEDAFHQLFDRYREMQIIP